MEMQIKEEDIEILVYSGHDYNECSELAIFTIYELAATCISLLYIDLHFLFSEALLIYESYANESRQLPQVTGLISYFVDQVIKFKLTS